MFSNVGMKNCRCPLSNKRYIQLITSHTFNRVILDFILIISTVQFYTSNNPDNELIIKKETIFFEGKF